MLSHLILLKTNAGRLLQAQNRLKQMPTLLTKFNAVIDSVRPVRYVWTTMDFKLGFLMFYQLINGGLKVGEFGV